MRYVRTPSSPSRATWPVIIILAALKIALLLMMLLIPLSQSSATTFTVPSNPLWTDTGLSVLATQTVTFTGATAAWSPVAGVLSGPGGFFVSGGTFDEWITNHQLGELLGFIGNPALNLNAGPPRVIAQDAPGLFVIGDTTVPVVETGRAGELWLGFNDDFASNGIGDNTGTASVTVTLSGVARVPEPASLFLLAFGLAALAGATWRRHRRK